MPIVAPPIARLVVRHRDGRRTAVPIRARHHFPAFRRRLAWLLSLPGVAAAAIVSDRGRQLYPVPPRRRKNPFLREDGDRDLPSTLTRD